MLKVTKSSRVQNEIFESSGRFVKLSGSSWAKVKFFVTAKIDRVVQIELN